MIKFVGNTSYVIDWETVVKRLEHQEPAYVGPRHNPNDDIIGIKEMFELWNKAGFKLVKDNGNAGWDMFFPKAHFDESIVHAFGNFVNATPVDCWISRIHPGNMTPWHWDCNDKEDEYSKLNMARFICCISEPQVGHAIMVEDDCLYFQERGNAYQWEARTDWHGGINCGLTPKYLFNFSGILK